MVGNNFSLTTTSNRHLEETTKHTMESQTKRIHEEPDMDYGPS